MWARPSPRKPYDGIHESLKLITVYELKQVTQIGVTEHLNRLPCTYPLWMANAESTLKCAYETQTSSGGKFAFSLRKIFFPPGGYKIVILTTI